MMEEVGERGGEKRKGYAPQVSKVPNEIRVTKPSEADLLRRIDCQCAHDLSLIYRFLAAVVNQHLVHRQQSLRGQAGHCQGKDWGKRRRIFLQSVRAEDDSGSCMSVPLDSYQSSGLALRL